MKTFIKDDSIVRKIWGKADTILFIFAGASAEFALNRAVDWLYFTGKLPGDPVGRLFTTVMYAHQIIFSEYDAALASIDQINAIHQKVEASRGAQIPDWAYRDVLFMLIDYSIRSFEILERKLTEAEKAETFDVFYRVGLRMGLTGLPQNYAAWKLMREEHLRHNLINSRFTSNLFKQYKKHLGPVRYQLLKQIQILLVPKRVNQLLLLGNISLLPPLLRVYKLARRLKLEWILKNVIVPSQYKLQIQQLDTQP